jgi:hypothetical protein
MLQMKDETREKAALEAGSMASNPLGWTIGKFIERGIDMFSDDGVTFRDLYPEGATFDPSKPMPLSFMINPPEAAPIELPAPAIVAGDNPEGVVGLDSWMWVEQLMQTRRQVAQAEIISEESARAAAELTTTTSTRLWPALLVGALAYFVLTR